MASSPYINRFLQPDTLIPGVDSPQTWNRYSYTVNNPILYNDPDGHCAPACLVLIPVGLIAAVAVVALYANSHPQVMLSNKYLQRFPTQAKLKDLLNRAKPKPPRIPPPPDFNKNKEGLEDEGQIVKTLCQKGPKECLVAAIFAVTWVAQEIVTNASILFPKQEENVVIPSTPSLSPTQAPAATLSSTNTATAAPTPTNTATVTPTQITTPTYTPPRMTPHPYNYLSME